jgi:serine/threonine-protein kinase
MNDTRRIGRYEIEAEIGRGSMGVVYRARDPRIGRIVALKCIAFSFPLPAGEEEEFLRRFYHEAQIAGRLSHPNIVTIHDVGTREAEGSAFIAMEHVTGTNLQELLAGGGRLPIPQIADLARQAADALDYAHGTDVVHRDVKPGNLVISPAGQLKILDFGIARLASGDITHPGRVMGTPNYMAPEQVTGGKVDGRADQFALAVTLYHLLTGERPFTGESVTAISYQVVNIAPPPPSRLNPSLPPVLDQVLARAMSKNPADRYPSCREFAADLATALVDWKEAASRATENTLVSRAGRSGSWAALAGAGSGVRRVRAWLTGPGAALGWGVALLVLGLLAVSPYLIDGLSGAGRAATSPIPRRRAFLAAPLTAITAAPVPAPPAPVVPPSETPRLPARGNATLVLELQHRIDDGAISVRVDGTEAVRENLRGAGGKTRWTREIAVQPGRHRVEARVTGDGVDELGGMDITVEPRGRRVISLSLAALTHRLKMRADAGGAEVTR